MTVYFPMEIVIQPDTTYIIANDVHVYVRRIYTDGRPWPDEIVPSFLGGYALGKWIDEDGDGRYDTLEIETRGFKGPRAVDLSGMPLHEDNQTVIKERLYLDKADPNLLHNRITIDRPRVDAAVDGDQELSPRPQSPPLLARAGMRRRADARADRHAKPT